MRGDVRRATVLRSSLKGEMIAITTYWLFATTALHSLTNIGLGWGLECEGLTEQAINYAQVYQLCVFFVIAPTMRTRPEIFFTAPKTPHSVQISECVVLAITEDNHDLTSV